MCTYTITVDEELLRTTYPGVSKERFGQWLQKWVDDMFPEEDEGQPTRLSPNAVPYDEVVADVRDQLRLIREGKMEYKSSEEVLSTIRKRYGF